MARNLLGSAFMRSAVTTMIALSVLSALSGCAEEPLTEAPEALVEGPALTAVGKADGTDLPAYNSLPAAADLDAPLSALFAPDDPVNTLELTLIESVITARGDDETERFEEGDNPYRIRYAVYNLRNPFIVDALIRAEAANVDVQILIEADQLDPKKDWNTADETFIAAGFEFAPDHRALDAAGRDTADLVGITGSGLMHLKARIFETPGHARVLSGSMNPGDHAVHNEETLHLVNDAEVVAAYMEAFEDIRSGSGFTNTWNDSAAVNVMFTPASGLRASTKVFEWLEAEQEQILLMVFSLRDISAPTGGASLVDLLAAKKAAGVDVYVITDRKQSDGVDADGNRLWWNDSTEDRLRAAGVPVYEATNRGTPFTAMHHKVAVLGRTHIRVISDAANWTKAGLGSGTRRAKNHESVLFIDSAALDDNRTGRRYLAQWLRVLERYADQSAGDGEAGYAEVAARLTASDGWPSEPVIFVAQDTHTDWGEGVAVVGDAAALGTWSLDSGGALLGTDGDSYPTWTAIMPVELPLASTIEWKLVIEQDGRIRRWENGDNRRSVVRPGPLTPTTTLEGTWR